eukprot:3519362-Rhodomonas_salina.1
MPTTVKDPSGDHTTPAPPESPPQMRATASVASTVHNGGSCKCGDEQRCCTLVLKCVSADHRNLCPPATLILPNPYAVTRVLSLILYKSIISVLNPEIFGTGMEGGKGVATCMSKMSALSSVENAALSQ